MTEPVVIVILGIGAFFLGWFVASWIWMVRFNKYDDRLLEAYIDATETMNDAIENPENSTEILEGYFDGLSRRKRQ